jgi:hypothetical protein
MHIDGGLEVARVVKNMLSLKVLDLNGKYWMFYFVFFIDQYLVGNCFGLDGIDEIRNVLENKNFLNQMAFR